MIEIVHQAHSLLWALNECYNLQVFGADRHYNSGCTIARSIFKREFTTPLYTTQENDRGAKRSYNLG